MLCNSSVLQHEWSTREWRVMWSTHCWSPVHWDWRRLGWVFAYTWETRKVYGPSRERYPWNREGLHSCQARWQGDIHRFQVEVSQGSYCNMGKPLGRSVSAGRWKSGCWCWKHWSQWRYKVFKLYKRSTLRISIRNWLTYPPVLISKQYTASKALASAQLKYR